MLCASLIMLVWHFEEKIYSMCLFLHSEEYQHEFLHFASVNQIPVSNIFTTNVSESDSKCGSSLDEDVDVETPNQTFVESPGTLKRVLWHFEEVGVILWRGWCGTLKRVMWYFEERGVLLWWGFKEGDVVFIFIIFYFSLYMHHVFLKFVNIIFLYLIFPLFCFIVTLRMIDSSPPFVSVFRLSIEQKQRLDVLLHNFVGMVKV